MIRYIAIDDEPQALTQIASYIKKTPVSEQYKRSFQEFIDLYSLG